MRLSGYRSANHDFRRFGAVDFLGLFRLWRAKLPAKVKQATCEEWAVSRPEVRNLFSQLAEYVADLGVHFGRSANHERLQVAVVNDRAGTAVHVPGARRNHRLNQTH